MRTPVAALVLLASFALTSLSGCGYRLGAVKPAQLANVTKIAIPTFKNKTYQPHIEVLMADTTIKQFQQDGTYEIVPDDRADAILYCTVEDIVRRQARAVLSNVLATREFSLKMTVEYELTDRVTGARIMSGKFNVDTSFYTNNDLATDQRQAIVNAAQEVAVKLTGEITEGF
ncbi:MAG TPA: LPS assembly lipoprotein LptE [Chthoniobacterales bacterium]|jgi:outer membrane lipopolysaccharide assembly protein LptE/RlpB